MSVALARRAVFLAAGLGASGLLTLVFHLLAARALGPAGFGDFSAAFALCTVGGIVFELGSSAWAAREVAARGREGAGGPWRAGMRLKVLLAAAGLPLLVALGQAVLGAPALCALLGAGAAAMAFSRHAFAAFRGFEETRYEALFSVGQRVALVALAAALLALSPTPLAAAAAYGSSAVLAALAALAFAARRYGLASSGPRVELRAVLAASLVPLAVAEAATAVYFRIDQVILQAFVNPGEVGRYAAAYRLMEGLMAGSTALGAALLPSLSRAAVSGAPALRKALRRALALAALAAVVLCAAGLVLGPPVLATLFGAAFTGTGPVFPILMGALALVCLNAPLTLALVAARRERAFAACALAAAAVNVAANLALVPSFGIAGAAWATLATEACLCACAALALARSTATNGEPR